MTILNRKLMTLTFGGAMALSGLSSTAAAADSACCTSGSSCAAMIKEMQASCAKGNASLEDSCKAMAGLTQYEWLLQNHDLSPLKADAKDVAGTYQVKVGGSFVMTNKWKKADAPGIKSDDKSDIALSKICYNTREVEINGSIKVLIARVPFQLSFRSDVQNVQGKRGYFATGGARNQTGRYFFSPVTPDRKPLDVL